MKSRGTMLRLREWGVGHCTDRLKDKSKENTCIQGGKQTVRKTKWKTRFETKDTQKSLISFSSTFPFPCFRESQCKEIRNSSYKNSFAQNGLYRDDNTIWKKGKKDSFACFKESVQICCLCRRRMGFSFRILRDEIAVRAETTVRYFNLVLSYTSTSFPEPLP